MNKVGDRCSLLHLKIGQVGKVFKIKNKNRFLEKRLMELGVTVGVEIEIKKAAPFGDPKCVCVRGYELCVRKEEMKQIIVEVLK